MTGIKFRQFNDPGLLRSINPHASLFLPAILLGAGFARERPVGNGFRHSTIACLRPRHDFKPRVEIDHHHRELAED
jgi:hypothetical protein